MFRAVIDLEGLLAWFDESAFRSTARVLEVSGSQNAALVRRYLARNKQLESFVFWPRIPTPTVSTSLVART